MIARLAADGVVVLHLAFVVFVVLGGMLAWRNPGPRVAAPSRGAVGRVCGTDGHRLPADAARERACARARATSGYAGSFVEHYLMPLLYPVGLTPGDQRWLGALVIAINVVVYAVAFVLARRRRMLPRRTKTS